MPTAKVIVFGSLNYDFVILGPRLPAPGETVKGDRLLMQTGGKGANQALQAARLGATTHMIGCIGMDFMGDEQLSCLAADGIVTDYIERCEDQKTGTALIFVEQGGQNAIMIAPNANGACSRELLDCARPAFAGGGIFVTQLETNIDSVLYAMELAKAAGCFLLLDPAPMQSVPGEIWAMADLVKPNETEAAYYTGMPVDEADITGWARAAARRLRAMGAPAALITLGARGCWYSGEQEFFVPPYPITAVDATAAGDSFAGGLAVALGEGRPIRDAIAFASACGALSASRAGAQPSIGRRGEVEAFLRQFGG
jgi:ribokinase